MATFSGPTLADIVASTSTIVVLIVFLRFWKPKRVLKPRRGHYRAQAAALRSQRRKNLQGVAALAGLEPGRVRMGILSSPSGWTPSPP